MNPEVKRALDAYEAELALLQREKAEREEYQALIAKCLEIRCCPECAGALARWLRQNQMSPVWLYRCSVCGWEHQEVGENYGAYQAEALRQMMTQPYRHVPFGGYGPNPWWSKYLGGGH